MCGIYIAQAENAGQKVLEGLKRLEYRGYDSWGVAVLQAGKLEVEKHTGKIGGVQTLVLPAAPMAIGHTRWATHGGVTQTNAHPHLASDGSFALVQNGVVENYQELKQSLQAKGYTFVSETDTEVIVHLLEEVKKNQGASILTLEIMQTAMKQLQGRSTVGVLTTTGEVLAFRCGSPLVIGQNQAGSFFLSSDVLSLSSDATRYYSVQNGELLRIRDQELTVTPLDAAPGSKSVPVFVEIDVESEKLDKEGFEHFMLKEMYEQSQVLAQVMRGEPERFVQLKQVLLQAPRVYTLGAGSASFAAGQLAVYLRQAGLAAIELKSYEARSYRSLFAPGDVCVVFSQSGETTDTLEVVEWMRAAGVKIVSLVNMSGSTLTALSDYPFMLQVGPEVGVASTKALTGQIVWSRGVKEILTCEDIAATLSAFTHKVEKFQEQLVTWMNSSPFQVKITNLAQRLVSHQHLFVLGRGQLYYPALEFALKIKEVSYLHAEGFSGGELKHGVIALIEKGTPVVCLITNDEEAADMLSATAEVKARGAWVIGVSATPNDLFDEWLEVPPHADFAAVVSCIPAQLLTYHLAVLKGLDPDKPRNLAKSVTVK